MSIVGSEVRAAMVAFVARRPQVAWCRRLPVPVAPDANPGAREQALVDVLVSLAGMVPRCRVVTALPGAAGIERLLRLPAMPEREMEGAVRWEAEQQIPVPLEGMLLRHVVLGPADGEGNQANVLIVAAPEQRVRDWQMLFARAGLVLAAIDLPALALWRIVFGVPGTVPGDGVVAVADLEPGLVHLLVADEGTILVTRNAAVNGSLESETSLLHLDVAAAAEGRGEPVLDAAAYGYALAELRRFLEYVQSAYRQRPVERLLLTGSGAGVPGVAERLVGELGLSVEVARLPLTVAEPEGEADLGPAFAISAGLALWGVEG
ncbi:MAG: pilus assembly protein PilM [Bacillota bacterium]|nr:pilus assembly protein PilM [Bacillota bacterium]